VISSGAGFANGTQNPLLSVVVATRNRARHLERALDSLAGALRQCAASVEVIVVNNGSHDHTERVIEAFYRVHAVPGRHLFAPEPGKARALNAAVEVAQGAALAFTDDDVEVPENWIIAAAEVATQYPDYAAATGPVRLPPGNYDAGTLERVRVLRTLPLFDLGGDFRETDHLYGCNMVVRRAVLQNLGGFDERLGPGASGLHEDGDLARRLRAAGQRILYDPRLVMFHTVDPERLTWEFFAALHRADARSRFVLDGNRGLPHALRRWSGGAIVWLLWTLLGNRARRTRAWGRLLSHTEYMRLCWQARRA
jgi:GT2 family glycosyltransferase